VLKINHENESAAILAGWRGNFKAGGFGPAAGGPRRSGAPKLASAIKQR